MRLNYTNFPALKVLDSKECMTFLMDEYDRGRFFCAYGCKWMTEEQKQRFEGAVSLEVFGGFYTVLPLYYIAPSFIEALHKSSDKLYKLLGSKQELEKVHEDCAFIHEDILWCIRRLPDGYTRMVRISKSGALFTSITFKNMDDNKVDVISTCENHTAISCISFYYVLMMLKKYGQVDVEIIPRKKRIRSEFLSGKAINDTGVDVKVLDSRWFKTICRDEGFLVSGHWRLQPKKDSNGEWTRELIYISPYAKKGYHRLAPVVNLDDSE